MMVFTGWIWCISLIVAINLPYRTQCVFPSGSPDQHHQGEDVAVKVQIQGKYSLIIDMTGEHDIAYLRNKLQSLYPVKQAASLSITVDRTIISLVSSPLLISDKFSLQIKAGKKSHDKSDVYYPTPDEYQPFCNYISSNQNEEAVFNLCKGVNGYYGIGDKKFTVHSQINHGSVHHSQSVSWFDEDHVSTPVDLSHLYNQTNARYKRDADKYYMELYIVCDYDFYRNTGKSDKTYSIDRIWSYNLQLSHIFLASFGVNIVIVGIEIWTSGNLIDVPVNKANSFKYRVDTWLNTSIKTYAKETVRPHTDFDAFLYVTTTPNLVGSTGGRAILDSACTDHPAAYVDLYIRATYTKDIYIMAHELAHLLGGKHITDYDNFYDCWCYPKQCILGQGILANTQSIWSKCTIQIIIDALPGASRTCLLNFPNYTSEYAQCGNKILDPGEDCEPYFGWQCCSHDCKVQGQCATGECCDTDKCQYFADERPCRVTQGVCDFEVRCDGRSNQCPPDRYRLDGTPCETLGRTYCLRGQCTTANTACRRMFFDVTASSTKKEGYALIYQRDKDKEVGFRPEDVYCRRICCHMDNNYWLGLSFKYKDNLYALPQEFETPQGTLRCTLIYPFDFNGNMDLIEETDGVRCGPQSICKNQTCVGVASYPSTCLQCPGQFGGCDQHHECYCDVKYHGNVSCNNGTYKPIEPGHYGWESDFGIRGSELEYHTGIPIYFYNKLQDSVQTTRLLMIVIPLVIVVAGLTGTAIILLRPREISNENAQAEAL